MGNGHEHFIDDERSDAAFRRVLALVDEPRQIDPPPDLVTRSLRRLPAEPPALAARRLSRRSWRRTALSLGVGAVILTLALLNLLSDAGVLPTSALILGDGSGGLSRVLLTLHLLTKPLLHSLAVDPLVLVGSAALALVGGGLWWWLVRQAPVYAVVEARQ